MMTRRFLLAMPAALLVAACTTNSLEDAGVGVDGDGASGAGSLDGEPLGDLKPIESMSLEDAVATGDSSIVQKVMAREFGDRVHFGYDSYSVDGAAARVLDQQAAFLALHPEIAVRIEGHCDARGTREYNLALGERRAQAVKDHLAMQGIAASRLTTVSFGKERPIAAGDAAADHAMNRRAQSIVSFSR